MGTLHHIGATLSQLALAERMGRSRQWVYGQGDHVRGNTELGSETWEACRYRDGRVWGYSLITLEERHDRMKGAQICAG